MGLARVYNALSQILVRHLGDGAGPRIGQVEDELNSLVAWAGQSTRVIESRFENVANAAGAGLKSLHSFSLPAGSLASTDDFVRAKYVGLFATNDNNKRLVFSIDSQVILDTGLQDIDLGVSTLVGWTGEVIYGRLGATSVGAMGTISFGQLMVDGAGAIVGAFPSNGGFMNKYNNLTVANLTSNAVTLLVQAESGAAAAGDIDQRISIIELYQQ